jgi:hypothetical protein
VATIIFFVVAKDGVLANPQHREGWRVENSFTTSNIILIVSYFIRI